MRSDKNGTNLMNENSVNLLNNSKLFFFSVKNFFQKIWSYFSKNSKFKIKETKIQSSLSKKNLKKLLKIEEIIIIAQKNFFLLKIFSIFTFFSRCQFFFLDFFVFFFKISVLWNLSLIPGVFPKRFWKYTNWEKQKWREDLYY